MSILKKSLSGLMLLTMLCAMPAVQAAIYQYTIEGTVDVGTETFGLGSNAFNLAAGDKIYATGVFTANLTFTGFETVSFATLGNTMIIDADGTFDLGGILLYASDDTRGGEPSLTFNNGGLYDLNFQKNTNPKFNSSFLYFDDLGGIDTHLFGTWTGLTLTEVPVPAAVWLFASGLAGLLGIARRRKTRSM